MVKKYIVRLTAVERTERQQLVNTGKAAAYKRRHAQILLKADHRCQGEGWSDAKIRNVHEIT